MMWLLLALIVGGGIYVATRKPAPAGKPVLSSGASRLSMTAPTMRSSTHFDPSVARATLARDGLLRLLHYLPITAPMPKPYMPTPLVGDALIQIRDHEAKQDRYFLLSSAPRGDEVRYMIATDTGTGLASGYNYLTIGECAKNWKSGGDIPEELAAREAFIRPSWHASARIVEFALDMADSLGIESYADLYLLSSGRELFRCEQALTRQRTVWSEVFKPMMPTLLAVFSTIMSAVAGAAGSAASSAICGFVSRAVTVAVDAVTRAGSLESKLGSVFGSLIMDPRAFEEFAALNISIGVRAGSYTATLAREMEAARALMQTYPDTAKSYASALMNTEVRLRAHTAAVDGRRAPYSIKGVTIFTATGLET